MTSPDQAEQYRQAAEDALQQLDWCIGYLHGIRKGKISRQLAKNRLHQAQPDAAAHRAATHGSERSRGLTV
jgi:hypothetical protein